ncbi:MAG TPA: 3-oxoacyl-ACP reductase FabG [Gammaproteobacteria bacterium]|nr:3-oxoacyl-ACP reductase FabG [Gammaproteobacteria bacterium]
MKRALVTGGSGDIGAAIARRLAAAGLEVIVHANSNPQRAEALAEALRGEGHSAASAAFDVTDGEATRAALEGLLDDGPIQVLVNNAGCHWDASFAGMTPEQWRQVREVSLDGFFNVTQPLTLPMARCRWGRIVSISSVAAVMGNPGQVNYAAAKAGLHGATRSLARELASRSITVNVVAPGIINGSMTAEAFDEAAIREQVPMQRAGEPEEVASVVGFLASEEAAYLSGQVISVNGAMA